MVHSLFNPLSQARSPPEETDHDSTVLSKKPWAVRDVVKLRDLTIWTGSRRIKRIQDLRIGDSWGTIDQIKGQRRSYHFFGQEVVEDLLEFLKDFACTKPVPLESCLRWQWGDLDLNFRSFILTTKQVRNLSPPLARDFSQWNQR